MAYLGKFYVVDKEENFVDFIKTLGLSEEDTVKYSSYKPKTKLEKNGDTYKVTTESPGGDRTVEFKSGVEFDEAFRPDLVLKSKYTVNGDTITQEMIKDGRTVIFKREYSADQLKVTISSNFSDVVAVRYYVPA